MKAELLDGDKMSELPRDSAERQVYDFLQKCELPFLAYHHVETPTADHVAVLEASIRGRHCKNLFLKNSKGDQLFMLIAPHDQNVNLRAVARQIGSTRLSFADSQKMVELLGLEPGAVSPFGLLNDHERQLSILLEEALFEYDYINFHPNVNTATLSLDFNDFIHYLEFLGYSYLKINSLEAFENI